MSEEIRLVIRQASGEDSAQLLALSQRVAKETDYLIICLLYTSPSPRD